MVKKRKPARNTNSVKARNIDSYINELGAKHGLSQEKIKKILTYGLHNVIKMMEAHQTIKLPKLGNIYHKH